MTDLNLNDSLPVLKVTWRKKLLEIYPVAFLGKFEESLGLRRKSKDLMVKEVTAAARKASGIKDLSDDEAARLIGAAQELLLRSQLGKKKLLRALGFSGSTPASAQSPPSEG